MQQRYGHANVRSRWQYWRKRYVWQLRRLAADCAKRILDITGAAILLFLLSPLAFVVAAMIQRSQSGTLLLWQTHVGRLGREFSLPRLRSANAPVSNTLNRLVQRLKAEHWPALWCVLTGEMSLVGPRPATPDETAEYSLHDRQRLNVRPGLVCTAAMAMASGAGSDCEMSLDVEYVEKRNLWLDCTLLVAAGKDLLCGTVLDYGAGGA